MPVSAWGRRPINIAWLLDNDWWSKVDVRDEDECWPWLLSVASHGYGQTWDRETVRLSHRVAWVLSNNQQIPVGMTVDHVCRNRRCCNPRHLRLLSNTDNARMNGFHDRTHCPEGHPYDETNTHLNSKGHRLCKTCRTNRRAA